MKIKEAYQKLENSDKLLEFCDDVYWTHQLTSYQAIVSMLECDQDLEKEWIEKLTSYEKHDTNRKEPANN